MDEESIENGLEVQKFLVVCLFWGGCHHPNKKTANISVLNKDGITVSRELDRKPHDQIKEEIHSLVLGHVSS